MLQQMQTSARRSRIPGRVATGWLAATLLFSGGLATQALEPLDLTGEMFVAGATPVDPTPDEPKTHAYFWIDGAGGLVLYDSIPLPEEPDICRGEGRSMKTVGALYCSIAEDRSEAECSFALHLETGETAAGLPC